MKTSTPRGLLFDESDLARIRENLELPRFSYLRQEIYSADLAADETFLRDEIKLTDRIADMARARKIAEHASLAFALSKDPAQLAVARLALKRLTEYKRWDYFFEAGDQPLGFQRAPEATIACCLALDWLGDALPEEERIAIEANIIAKGAPACFNSLYGMKYPDRVRGWGPDPEEKLLPKVDMLRFPLILNATNLKVIPICGLGFAAIWFHGRHPSAASWLDLARSSARAFATMYGEDGSYDEGVSYWGYTTMHMIMFADALYRRLGIDDRKLVNYPGTLRYALNMSLPTQGEPLPDKHANTPYNAVPKGVVDPSKGVVNFGDAMGSDLSVAPWVGQLYDDPVANYAGNEIGLMKFYPAAIWFHGAAPVEKPGTELRDVRFANDVVVSRTGWSKDDTVVALRSGGPANHEHADRNSILFAAHGERLFHDPFKASYTPANPRWCLRLTESHTAVLIDGQGHQYHDGSEGTNSSWAWARVISYHADRRAMVVTSDATEAYQLVLPDVQRVWRTLVFVKPDVLLIFDQVKLTKDAPMQMRYQIYNDDEMGRGEVSTDGFTITRPLAHMNATVKASGPIAIMAGRIDLPPEEPEHPMIEVESASATDHAVLTVCAAQKTGEEIDRLQAIRDGDTWRVTGEHNGIAIDVEIEASGDAAPLVTV